MEKRLIINKLVYIAFTTLTFDKWCRIFLGGSQILTPEGFLDNIKKLSSGSSFAEGDDE